MVLEQVDEGVSLLSSDIVVDPVLMSVKDLISPVDDKFMTFILCATMLSSSTA